MPRPLLFSPARRKPVGRRGAGRGGGVEKSREAEQDFRLKGGDSRETGFAKCTGIQIRCRAGVLRFMGLKRFRNPQSVKV